MRFEVAFILGSIGACRATELRDLRIRDVEDTGESLMMTIRSEKRQNRTFIIGDHWYPIVKAYLALRPMDLTHDYFFIKYSEGRGSHLRMHLNSFLETPVRIANFLGLESADDYRGYSYRFDTV